MDTQPIKVISPYSNLISVNIYPGHYATNHSHINYYMDMTNLKTRLSMAQAAAKSIVSEYVTSTIVDTIVCMDGTEIIGAYLAEELTNAGFMSVNAHQTIYILSPEINSDILRNFYIQYYGGMVAGISALFSATHEINGHEIRSIFDKENFPEYQTYPHHECPFCKEGRKLDAIVNSYGYMKL